MINPNQQPGAINIDFNDAETSYLWQLSEVHRNVAERDAVIMKLTREKEVLKGENEALRNQLGSAVEAGPPPQNGESG